MLSKNEINNRIFNYWNNFLFFKQKPKIWDNIVIRHNLDSWLWIDEIYILSFFNWWNVISVWNNYFDYIFEYINTNWYNLELLKNEFKKLTSRGIKVKWPVISFYLFYDKYIMNESLNIKAITEKDKMEYYKFLSSCDKIDLEKVDINLFDITHRLFWFFEKEKLVSLWNYSIDEETKIAHIWIITLKCHQWKWFWKVLVNWIVKDILANWFIPQYRVLKNNLSSLKIARSLWFEEILETLSIINI